MRSVDGVYSISVDELTALVGGEEFWWVLPDGSTVSSGVRVPPVEGALFLMSRSGPWVDQWGGDLQRACDEQLNPMLASYGELFPEQGS